MQTLHVKRSARRAPCQPPSVGECDERVMVLLREVLKDPNPPAALVGRALAAKRHVIEMGRHAEGLAELARTGVGLIEATSIMAATAPGHDPYDLDEVLRSDADGSDLVAALGLLLRVNRSAGQALDGAVTAYIIDDADDWRGIHHGHAELAATALLHTAMRRWPDVAKERRAVQ